MSRPSKHLGATSGETIGRYCLHTEIAKGGMARIHIARAVGSRGFSRLVAAKRLHPLFAADAELVKMFLDEARVASKVRHRNVVPVIDVVNIDGEVIIVQELVHGVALNKACGRAQKNRSWLPLPISISIATQALAGLHAAHEAADESGAPLNVVHRDVSPQNIMIAADGTTRLLDFGIAKSTAAAYVTHTGAFKGKLAYSAPEQLRGTATRQTDIYALGVVLWELVVAKRLHANRSDEQILNAVAQTTPAPVTRALGTKRAAGSIDDVTWRQIERLEPILARACAYDPAQRYATAADMETDLVAAVPPASPSEVAAWLRQLVGDLLDENDRLIAEVEASWRSANGATAGAPISDPASATGIDTTPEARGGRRRSRRVLGILSSAVALALVTVMVFLWRSSPSAFDAAQTTTTAPPVFETTRASSVEVESSPPVRAPDEPVSSGEPNEAPVDKPPVAQPAKRTTKPVKRRAVVRKPVKKTSTKPADCSTPFYYEGNKKVFKTKCV